jgi:thiosulfate/3-mercaptopyruvate sulfurtransferase
MLEPVISIDWLGEHRDAVVLADVRYYLDGRSGAEAFVAGHLPGAVFVDLEASLSGPGSPEAGRHPLPDPERFARGMSDAGIGDDTTVIGYDDAGGVIAARLVWMLRALDHDAALLDGGLSAYDGPLETTTNTPQGAHFTPQPWPQDRLADADDAAGRANVVIDARQRERFAGTPDALDPRWGHIPGARSVPCREHLDAPAGHLKPVPELRKTLAGAGVTPGVPVVSYCGSGVTACHNLLVIEHAGLGQGRLYPGSWSQWSNDATRAIETR